MELQNEKSHTETILSKILNRIREITSLTKTQVESAQSIIIYGDKGIGKTTILGTCPKPILIHSFDQKGTTVLSSQLGSGVFVDNSYEFDDPENPTVYLKWLEDFKQLLSSKAILEFKTFAIDSFTMFCQNLLNHVFINVTKYNLKSKAPGLQDYGVLWTQLQKVLSLISTLPIHTILTLHTDKTTDDNGIVTEISPSLIGQSKTKAPIYFSELYYLKIVKDKQNNPIRVLQTQSDSQVKCSTRIGANQVLNPYEPADISKLLSKAGIKC